MCCNHQMTKILLFRRLALLRTELTLKPPSERAVVSQICRQIIPFASYGGLQVTQRRSGIAMFSACFIFGQLSSF